MMSLTTCTEEAVEDMVGVATVDELMEVEVADVGDGELQAVSTRANAIHTTRNLVLLWLMAESLFETLCIEQALSYPAAQLLFIMIGSFIYKADAD